MSGTTVERLSCSSTYPPETLSTEDKDSNTALVSVKSSKINMDSSEGKYHQGSGIPEPSFLSNI